MDPSRRHLTYQNKALTRVQAKAFYQEAARKRQLATQKNNAGRAVRLNSDELEKSDTLVKATNASRNEAIPAGNTHGGHFLHQDDTDCLSARKNEI
jgi:hypothetical protein